MAFEQLLSEILQFMKIPGIHHLTQLQEQIIKYIER